MGDNVINNTQLRTRSLAVVAKDILEDEVYVDVYPIELYPSFDGEVSTTTDITNTLITDPGTLTKVITKKGSLIKAKWIPDGDTNRLEPPTVCKGEIVRLYRYGDTDKYYWNTLYNQLDLRKLEKRTIVVSNKASINVPPDELLDHTYSMTMDTINKVVHLRTSTTDGEYTTYDITIDTKEGLLEITDGQDNLLLLDSQDDKWVLSSNKTIIVNTTDKTDNIRNHYGINLKTYAVNNGADELVTTLSDFVQTVIDAIGVGNLGAGVPMDGGTKSKLSAIKARIDGFR